jgi:hypothetical protein
MNLEKAFWKFHKENPHVYKLIVKYAREAKKAGFVTYGMKSIFERVRWHVHMEKAVEEFKMNNNFSSRYSRLVMKKNRDLRAFFKTRPLNGPTSTTRKRTPVRKA